MTCLREYLLLAIGRDAASVSAYRRPLGYQQILAATLAASTPLTVPAGSPGYAIIQCEGAGTSVRWTDDRVTVPASGTGCLLLGGQELDYSGDLTMLRFIADAGAQILNISYYG
jgi:hypothetical protein